MKTTKSVSEIYWSLKWMSLSWEAYLISLHFLCGMVMMKLWQKKLYWRLLKKPKVGVTMSQAKPSLKIETGNTICWNSFSIFRDYGLNHISFRNKTFLSFKIESWSFQHLYEKEFHETSKNFNSIRQRIEKKGNENCLNELNELTLCDVSRNHFSSRHWKFHLSILKNKKNIL